MIIGIQALHYKGFKYIDAELSSYNILVGPNASGKSSLVDILTLIRDVLDKGPASAVESRCSQFRELVWNQQYDCFELVVDLELPTNIETKYRFARYEIALRAGEKDGIVIENENLWLIKATNGGRPTPNLTRQLEVFPHDPIEPEHIVHERKRTPTGWRKVVSKSTRGNDYFKSENTDWNIVYRFGPKKASLARIPEDETRFPVALWVKDSLMEGIQFLQLDSVDMRWPCRPDAPISFEPSGSNLAKVIRYLRDQDGVAFKRWVGHVATALSDVETIEVRERPEDRHLYIQIRYRNDLIVPSWLLSDGTLRLLAQTVIAYLPERDKVYIIEEPENGLHPQAIETVVQSLSSVYENQVILATHSPAVLRLSEPKDILCFSKTESGAIDIVRGEQHPRLKEWKRGVDLATLHAAGVLQ